MFTSICCARCAGCVCDKCEVCRAVKSTVWNCVEILACAAVTTIHAPKSQKTAPTILNVISLAIVIALIPLAVQRRLSPTGYPPKPRPAMSSIQPVVRRISGTSLLAPCTLARTVAHATVGSFNNVDFGADSARLTSRTNFLI